MIHLRLIGQLAKHGMLRERMCCGEHFVLAFHRRSASPTFQRDDNSPIAADIQKHLVRYPDNTIACPSGASLP